MDSADRTQQRTAAPDSVRENNGTTEIGLAALLGVMFVGLALRGAAIATIGDAESDPDGYVSIAVNLKQTGVFAAAGAKQPSAFRPPLYPVIGSFASRRRGTDPDTSTARVVFGWLMLANLLAFVAAGTWTAGLDEIIRPNSTDGWVRASPLALFSLSPLGIAYTAQPMTEVVCGALLLASLAGVLAMDERPSIGRAVFTGLMAALACLCRPTCFVTIAGWGGWLLWRVLQRRKEPERDDRTPRHWTGIIVAAAVGLAVIAPWGLRNLKAFGRPIVTTTHGGYTLLLGNNDAFYDEVVRQPWGTVWTGEQLAAWSDGLQAEMAAAGVEGELARDAYQKAKSRETITRRPGDFLRACVLRVVRFWNVVPQGPAAERLPAAAYWAVAVFYATAWGLAIAGVAVAWRHRMGAMVAVAIPPLAFTLVHAVYWSNARMRLPVEPCVFLFAGLGAETVWRWTVGRFGVCEPGEP